MKNETVLDVPISQTSALQISGDATSRRRQYVLAACLAVLIGGLGHFSRVDSTIGVYLLLESLIAMVAFITGMFALIRYFSNRGTLFLYAGLGFLAAGSLELIRLLAFTTGFAITYRGGEIDSTQYLLWTGTIIHLYLAMIICAAMWDTHGLQSRVARRTSRVALYVGGLAAACAFVLVVAPVPANLAWMGIPRPLEFIPGLFWGASALLLYRRGIWRHDTFVHWLVMALIIAVGAAFLLYPFGAGLTDAHSLVAQIIKFSAFALVLVGLGNSMFELVRRVESAMQSVQQLNVSLENEIQVRRETERALRASRAELAEAQQIARLGSWTWDLSNHQYQMSDELYQILGDLPDQGPQSLTTIRTRIHQDDLPRVTAIVSAAIAQQTDWETYCRVLRKDGEVRILLLRGRTVWDDTGNLARYRGAAQDLTDLVQTQQRLRETAELLAASNRDLEEFAYIASHDLQEPLRKIFAFSDRVISKYSDVLDATGRDYLDRVRQSASRMQGLIEAVLTLSRVNTRSTTFVQVALDHVITDVLEDLAEQIEESGATITVEPLPVAPGDPVQMRQLFQNLVGNALKFCRPSAPPVVWITTAEPRFMVNGAPFCTIKVADEGIGFDSRYAERIFHPFHRLHSRAKFEGTGMGLSICRRIVERHGGQIRAESTPGQGSRFFITLPLVQIMPMAPAETDAPAEFPVGSDVGNNEGASSQFEN